MALACGTKALFSDMRAAGPTDTGHGPRVKLGMRVFRRGVRGGKGRRCALDLRGAAPEETARSMLFWIVASLLALLVTATLVLPLLRVPAGAASGEADPGTATAIYRGQLAEIDRDLAAGTLDPDEAEAARLEVSRRLLDADRRGAPASGAAPRRASVLAGLAAALVLTAGALGLYQWLGAPGYPDVPRERRIAASEAARVARISQAEAEERAAPFLSPVAEADLPEETRTLIAQLREIVPTRPDDLEGWELLSRHEAALGNFGAAARAQERVIAIKGDGAAPSDVAALADRLVSAAAGFVSPEVETMLRGILEEDEGNAAARYYLGLLYFQTDRPDVAFRFWRDLAEQGSLEDPHVQLARAGVEDAAFRAGLTYSLPAGPSGPSPNVEDAGVDGPSAEDVAAMAALSPEDRAARIEGMVAGLAAELAQVGGTAEKWAQLVTALGVLDRREEAEAIWRESLTVFADDPAALALLAEAAAGAGLVP